MITDSQLTGIKFAFSLTDDHPAFVEGEDMLYDSAYALHDLCEDLELYDVMATEKNMVVVFEYDGSLEDSAIAYESAKDWLNSMYEGYTEK